MDDYDMGSDLERVLLTESELADGIARLAAEIDKDYSGREILLVGVLKGAVMVMADLARALHRPTTMDWMAISSYGVGHQVLGRGAHPQGPRHGHRAGATCWSSRTSSTPA